MTMLPLRLTTLPLAACALACTFLAAHAEGPTDNECAGVRHLKADCLRKAPAHAASMYSGEVKAINTADNNITLKLRSAPPGAPLKPGAEVTLPAQKRAMLATVREGDKVKFTTDNIGGKMMITELQPEG